MSSQGELEEMLWPVVNPPTVFNEADWSAEDFILKPIQRWVIEAFETYLPNSVKFALVAPLPSDHHAVSLAFHHFCRTGVAETDMAQKMAITSWVFQEARASLFKTLLSDLPNEPCIVHLSKDKTESFDIPGVNFGSIFVEDSKGWAEGYPELEEIRFEPIHLSEAVDFLDHRPAVEFRLSLEKLRELQTFEHLTSANHDILEEILRGHIEEHPYWIPVFSPVLSHVDIFLVWSPSLRFGSAGGRDRIGAAAVTFLVERNSSSTPELFRRMLVIAHELDGFMGTAHEASVNQGRERGSLESLEILAHQLNGLAQQQASRDGLRSARESHCWYLTLEGAVSYAQRTAKWSERRWSELGLENEPFGITLREAFGGNDVALTIDDEEVWNHNVDLRVVPMLIALASNTSSGPPGSRAVIVLGDVKHQLATISVHGEIDPEAISEIRRRAHSFVDGASTALRRGLGSIFRVVGQLGSETTEIMLEFDGWQGGNETALTLDSGYPLTIRTPKLQNIGDSIGFAFRYSNLRFLKG